MSAVAQELDSIVMDLIRDPIMERIDESEWLLASIVVDIIRNINEHGYIIVKKVEYVGEI